MPEKVGASKSGPVERVTLMVKLLEAKAQLLELSQARTFQMKIVLLILLMEKFEVFVAPVMLIVSFAWKVPVRLW